MKEGHDRAPDRPRMIKILLKVTDKGDYDWVECGACDAGWQVPNYAESVG